MNAFPVDDTRSYDVVKLENNYAISEIGVQPIDVWVDTHTIHPVSIS